MNRGDESPVGLWKEQASLCEMADTKSHGSASCMGRVTRESKFSSGMTSGSQLLQGLNRDATASPDFEVSRESPYQNGYRAQIEARCSNIMLGFESRSLNHDDRISKVPVKYRSSMAKLRYTPYVRDSPLNRCMMRYLSDSLQAIYRGAEVEGIWDMQGGAAECIHGVVMKGVHVRNAGRVVISADIIRLAEIAMGLGMAGFGDKVVRVMKFDEQETIVYLVELKLKELLEALLNSIGI
ncbi:hypothetical protein BJ165DRAFT_1398618 [Panaeolus papilionaceus]|nr:hypothetical protein BJ165DRAFT_1398618 [Panaeolus papilionaceus]